MAAMASITMPTMPAVASSQGAGQVVSLDRFKALRDSAEWSILRAKLAKWRTLPDDWDGENAEAPVDAVVDAASEMVRDLILFDAPLPLANIAGDGEVSFEWEKGEGYASASFTDDGHFVAFLQEDSEAEPLRIDDFYSPEVMRPFLERIGAFA